MTDFKTYALCNYKLTTSGVVMSLAENFETGVGLVVAFPLALAAALILVCQLPICQADF